MDDWSKRADLDPRCLRFHDAGMDLVSAVLDGEVDQQVAVELLAALLVEVNVGPVQLAQEIVAARKARQHARMRHAGSN